MSTQVTPWLSAAGALSAGMAAGAGLVEPRAAWVIVVLLLAVACAALWRLGSTRRRPPHRRRAGGVA